MVWYQRELDGKENALGKDHHSALDTVYNMGGLFEGQGDYAKILPYFLRARDGYEKVYGADHPETRDAAERVANARPSLLIGKEMGRIH